MAYAFRCRNCNMLEESGHAGERSVPRGCRLCGAGTHFELNAAGIPVAVDDPDNWIVLADLEGPALDKILKYHAISRKDIAKHTPTAGGPSREPRLIERAASETVGVEDKPA